MTNGQLQEFLRRLPDDAPLSLKFTSVNEGTESVYTADVKYVSAIVNDYSRHVIRIEGVSYR